MDFVGNCIHTSFARACHVKEAAAVVRVPCCYNEADKDYHESLKRQVSVCLNVCKNHKTDIYLSIRSDNMS